MDLWCGGIKIRPETVKESDYEGVLKNNENSDYFY